MATQRQVIDLHCAHPAWSANDIAQALGCSAGYVRATAQRLNITLPRATPESIEALGHAAREAGLTIADIQALAKRRAALDVAVIVVAGLFAATAFSIAGITSSIAGASL